MTDKPNWTPGPWSVHTEENEIRFIVGKDGDVDYALARVFRRGSAAAQNACLIAAVPTLYAALAGAPEPALKPSPQTEMAYTVWYFGPRTEALKAATEAASEPRTHDPAGARG